jgi:hypothetical protein
VCGSYLLPVCWPACGPISCTQARGAGGGAWLEDEKIRENALVLVQDRMCPALFVCMCEFCTVGLACAAYM